MMPLELPTDDEIRAIADDLFRQWWIEYPYGADASTLDARRVGREEAAEQAFRAGMIAGAKPLDTPRKS